MRCSSPKRSFEPGPFPNPQPLDLAPARLNLDELGRAPFFIERSLTQF